MGVAPEVSLVVKHTFLEFINVRPRARAFTDTELLESVEKAAAPGDSAAEPIPQGSPAPSPCAWPMTPMLEAGMPVTSTERGEMVNMQATMEVKAVLGMGECGLADFQAHGGEPWLPPAASLDDLQDPTMVYQQPWVFVPFADFDCCGVQGAWAEGPWQQPATSSVSTASNCNASNADSSSGDSFETPAGDLRTTVMLRNLPNALTREALLQMLDGMGFGGQFDMVYVPVDFSTGAGLGYAFINMCSPGQVPRLWEALDGLSTWTVDSDKVCSVSWSDPHQGLAAHIERYQNSPVMHPDVPDEWKPALFMNGCRVEFPPPTKKLKAPKVRSKKSAAEKAAVAATA